MKTLDKETLDNDGFSAVACDAVDYIIGVCYYNFGACSSPEAKAMKGWAEDLRVALTVLPKKLVIVGVGDSCQPAVHHALHDITTIQWIDLEGLGDEAEGVKYHDAVQVLLAMIAGIDRCDLVIVDQRTKYSEGFVERLREKSDPDYGPVADEGATFVPNWFIHNLIRLP